MCVIKYTYNKNIFPLHLNKKMNSLGFQRWWQLVAEFGGGIFRVSRKKGECNARRGKRVRRGV